MVFMGEPSNTHRVKKLKRMRILSAHTFFCEITITFLIQEARNKNLSLKKKYNDFVTSLMQYLLIYIVRVSDSPM